MNADTLKTLADEYAIKMAGVANYVKGDAHREARTALFAAIDALEAARNAFGAAERIPVTDQMAQDAALLNYLLAIGPNQSMNILDAYDDWDGSDNFKDYALKAMKEQT